MNSYKYIHFFVTTRISKKMTILIIKYFSFWLFYEMIRLNILKIIYFHIFFFHLTLISNQILSLIKLIIIECDFNYYLYFYIEMDFYFFFNLYMHQYFLFINFNHPRIKIFKYSPLRNFI